MWNYSSKNMTEKSLFFNVLFLGLVIICCAISQCSSALSDKRLCYDPDCSEPVSLAKTTLKYVSNDNDLLSFPINANVKVYSKEAGKRDDLWGVEINGKRGYAPKSFFREYKILQSKLKHVVPTKPSVKDNGASHKVQKLQEDENKSLSDIKHVEASINSINNLNVQSTPELSQKEIHATPSYEVVDGTTVHLTPDVSPVHTQVVPAAIEPTVLVNKEGVINNAGIGLSNGSTKSNVFTDSDKVPKVALIEKIEKEEQKVFDNINNNNFVTSSVLELSVPEVTGTETKSLDRGISSDTIKHKTESIKDAAKDSDMNENKHVSNMETKEIISLNEQNNLNLNEAVKYNDTLSLQIGKNNTVGTSAPENETINGTTPNVSHSTESNKFENKDVQFLETVNNFETYKVNETQHSKNETTSVTGNIKSDIQEANNSNVSETNKAQYQRSEAGHATSKVKSDIQGADTSDTPETKEVQSSKNEVTTVIDNIITNTEKASSSDKSETKEVQSPSNEIIASTGNIMLDIQKTNNSNMPETKETQFNKSETIVVTSNVKSDTKGVDTPDISEAKADQSITESTISDIENVSNRETSKIDGTESPKNEAIATANDVKSDTEKADISHTLETKDAQSAEMPKETGPSLENLIKNTTSDSTSDIKHEKQFDEIETGPSLENLTKNTTSDSKSDIKHEKQFDEIEVKNTDIPENITVDININTENNVRGTDAADTLNDAKSQFVESIVDVSGTPNVEDVQVNANTMQLTTADANKNDEYMSSLFLQLSATNQAPKTVVSDSVKASTQNTENISGHNVNSMQHDTNIEDTVLATDAGSNIQPVVNIVESVSAGEAILDVQPNLNADDNVSVEEATSQNIIYDEQVSSGVCTADNIECSTENNVQDDFPHHDLEDTLIEGIHIDGNYWMTLMYLSVTAIATLIFSLGYYRIENMRRDRHLIARINKLEKELLISDAELTMVNENLKSTKEKLNRMEDESFGSDEMVLSLRADLESLQNVKVELEDQVVMLEKDLESATEAGLELEKMLREVLSANNDVNPLAQSVEDLQTRLNAQQAANESLTNALSLKTQENESLSVELRSMEKKYEELEVEFRQVTQNLRREVTNKNIIEQTLNNKVQQLEMQIKEISTEKTTLQKKLKGKEVEAKDLIDVINKLNSNNLDLDKLYNVSHIKAEATTLLEERNELKIRLAEIEGAYSLLEEHVKVVKEEIATLSEQCKVAEKEKKDAETRLEVLTNFFEEKEAQRQKEEAIWLQQQGEVVSTVERIQMLQNEIQNYKQQIEMLKREILDQEREYKGQISLLETKAHEQWVIARQVERHLEESKVEAGQLRNRLTLIEKNLNDVDSEVKLHRLAANGETTSSPPLFMGAEPCNYPLMFCGSSSGPLAPPPSYLHSLFPPYLPPPLPNASEVPPYEVNQRPPPLGARLSSPPPMPPLHPPASDIYDNAGSLPPMSPHLLPPPLDHRSPLPPYSSEMYPPPPLPPPGSILPPSLGAPRSWGDESLPPPRNSGFHPAQRDRVRNHKGSLHSSGESLDKSHHSKV